MVQIVALCTSRDQTGKKKKTCNASLPNLWTPLLGTSCKLNSNPKQQPKATQYYIFLEATCESCSLKLRSRKKIVKSFEGLEVVTHQYEDWFKTLACPIMFVDKF